MATTYDFTILSNQFINGLSLVISMNEQAWHNIEDELFDTLRMDQTVLTSLVTSLV